MEKIGNPVLDNVLLKLNQAFGKTKAPIWRTVIEELSKAKSKRRHVNLGKISRLTKKGDVILVPGKVMAGGTLTHSLVIGAYSYSQNALKSISKARGKALLLVRFVDEYTDGEGVKLIG